MRYLKLMILLLLPISLWGWQECDYVGIISEAKVDTITGLQYSVGTYGYHCGEGSYSNLTTNAFAYYYIINSATDWVVYYAYGDYCGADSIYIDSTVIIARPYCVDPLDTLLFGVLQPKTTLAWIGFDELIFRDTIVIDSSTAHNTTVLYKNTTAFTLNQDNKLMIYGLDISNLVRIYGFILYSHIYNKWKVE